jgi:predicted phosphodiesterase
VRHLILSDIHADREALEAVLRASEGQYDDILCLGDIVGYGADPEWVIAWARETLQHVVRGNHDKVCAGLEDLEWFNPAARASAVWTHNVLQQDSLRYLAQLPAGPAAFENAMLVHGSPLDEDEYLIQLRDAAELAPYLESQLTFFGHTHVQGGFLVRGTAVKRLAAVPGKHRSSAIDLDADSFYLINPGSVGQPRDGDPRAAYAIYEPERRFVEYFRVEYDISSAQDKVREAGLPASLATRLGTGN